MLLKGFVHFLGRKLFNGRIKNPFFHFCMSSQSRFNPLKKIFQREVRLRAEKLRKQFANFSVVSFAQFDCIHRSLHISLVSRRCRRIAGVYAFFVLVRCVLRVGSIRTLSGWCCCAVSLCARLRWLRSVLIRPLLWLIPAYAFVFAG